MKYPNRVAVWLTAAAALCAGLAPVVADLDVSSTVGVVAAIASVTAVVDRWLKGWQSYEARQPVASQSTSTNSTSTGGWSISGLTVTDSSHGIYVADNRIEDPEDENIAHEEGVEEARVQDYSALPDDEGDTKAAGGGS